MFIAPVTNYSDIPGTTTQDDHRRRDYHYTLHYTDAHTAEPIPLIHWLMVQKDIYEKRLATLNGKKRPGSQNMRAPTKRPARANPPAAMFSMTQLWMQQQQQMTQLLMGQFAPQDATGLMDSNWTPTAPPAVTNHAVQAPQQAPAATEAQISQTPQQAPQGQLRKCSITVLLIVVAIKST